MFRANERRQGMSAAIFGLWRNWAVAVGLLTVLTVLAPVVPRQWLAPINIGFYILLQIFHTELRKRDFPSCSRLIQQVSAVMMMTAVTLVALYFFGLGENPHELTGQPYDINSPIIAILITAPVATIVTLYYWLNRREPLVCQQCKMRYGNVIEHGFVGDLYRKEWRYQTKLLFVLSLVLSVVDWAYYMLMYVNTNLNRADLFFFIWMPLVMYVLSLVYLGARYHSLWVYFCQKDEEHFVEQPGSTTLRFLVICNDRLLLNFYPTQVVYANGARVKRFDTPVIARTTYHERENLPEAVSIFKNITGIPDAEIKFAYSSPGNITYRNIFHYFAFLDDDAELIDSSLEGEWLTWGNVQQLARQSLIDRDLVAELHRIYRIAMAWKTYDADGKRLYKIKHYRPTFRLRDLRNWEVDFNDHRWLKVAHNNQDSFWYSLRRLLSRRPGLKRG